MQWSLITHSKLFKPQCLAKSLIMNYGQLVICESLCCAISAHPFAPFGDNENTTVISLTRLSYFWKILVTKYRSKVAQVLSDFWAISNNDAFSFKSVALATIGKIGLLLIPTSGHTDCESRSCPFIKPFWAKSKNLFDVRPYLHVLSNWISVHVGIGVIYLQS